MSKLTLVALLFILAFAPGIRVEAATLWTSASPNFHIRSYRGGPTAADVLKQCDLLRGTLQRLWLDADDRHCWRPPCQVVLHATHTSYLQAVGRGGGQTSGSSLIQVERGCVVARRIDLLADREGDFPALAHELTHIVLADRFGGRRPPRWLDEGIATMADAAEKRMLHRRDCQDALRDGSALRVFEVLTLEEFTSSRQVPPFYGQSLSLVRFLATRDEPKKIVDFAEAAIQDGYDRALRQYYGIEDVAALERQWRTFAAARAEDKPQPIAVTVSHRRQQAPGAKSRSPGSQDAASVRVALD